MTKIVVDKRTAMQAVCELFHIPIVGTQPIGYEGQIKPTTEIEIYFDFDKDYKKGDK